MSDKIPKDIKLDISRFESFLRFIIFTLCPKGNEDNFYSIGENLSYSSDPYRVEFGFVGKYIKIEGHEIISKEQIEKISNLSDVSTAKSEICKILNKAFADICSSVVSNAIAEEIFEIEKKRNVENLKNKLSKMSKDLHEDKIESEAKEDSVRRIKI